MSDYADRALKNLEQLQGWLDLTPEQLAEYKRLRAEEIEAIRRTHAYLDGLLPKPLDPATRAEMYESKKQEFYSNSIGDGMDEERLDAEVDEMSDWEFIMNFGGEDDRLRIDE